MNIYLWRVKIWRGDNNYMYKVGFKIKAVKNSLQNRSLQLWIFPFLYSLTVNGDRNIGCRCHLPHKEWIFSDTSRKTHSSNYFEYFERRKYRCAIHKYSKQHYFQNLLASRSMHLLTLCTPELNNLQVGS